MSSRHLMSAVAGMLLTIAVPITVSAHAALVDAVCHRTPS